MPRPPGTLLAAVLASAALVAAGCGSSEKTASPTTATGATPTTSIAATATSPPVTTPTATTPAATTTTPSSSGGGGGKVITGSSNGKVYRCIGPGLLHDLRAMSRRIERGRKSLKRIRAELRRLKRRYPNRVAPPRVAQRYNYLVRKHNALLALGNRRVHAYNARLNRDCIHR